MLEGRIVVIPFLQGKLTADGSLIEPDVEAILQKWLERHPEFRGAARDYQIIKALSYVNERLNGLATILVRVTAAVSPDLAAYDPAQDRDLYEEFLHEDEDSPPPPHHKIWIDQCEAAERIEAEYGTEKAMGYLIGEKLLNFLEVAEINPEWRAEISDFIAKIKEIFERWQIVAFLETPRRLGALGHTADDKGHEILRGQLAESEKLREDSRNLILIERAREWLLEE